MNEFSLALLGDGIFGRWGQECAELQSELARLYTHSTFEIANHGRDHSRAGNALWRISNDYEGRKSLSYSNPQIVVVESCAYSQSWDGPEGLSEYRDLLRRIWDEIARTTTARVLFCIAGAPPRDQFLQNAPEFFNSSKATRGRFADSVKMYLDEARSIAEDEVWPIADVQTELARRIKEGDHARRYFDQGDTFHPSRFGYALLSRVLVREIDNNRFIEEKIQK